MAQHNSSKGYPAEFKRDAVGLVRSSPERTVAEIAAELGVSGQSPSTWVGHAYPPAIRALSKSSTRC